MKIFNVKLNLKQKTPTQDVDEINGYSLNWAIQCGLEGVLVGIMFYVKLEGKVFQVTQAEDYHIIYYIPDGSTAEDWELVYDHNPSDGEWDELSKELSLANAKLLKELWLYEIDNSYNNEFDFLGHVA